MTAITKQYAKNALINLIEKSRVHMYKPIQIAEILYHHRVSKPAFDLMDLEYYRNKSKAWRNEISLPLLGRVCTSSSKYQDNLFDENAIPPKVLAVLGKENKRTKGAVEAYIYRHFSHKHEQLSAVIQYCEEATLESFSITTLLHSFRQESGLKRSIDKIYEIIVYALFSTIIDALQMKVEVSVSKTSLLLLQEFEDFSQKVMCIDTANLQHIQEAKVYRVGVTNAADRGLDMYSNWGPAIQIKHLSLNEELAENIVTSISSDRIVIVCKEAEKGIILSLLNQIGWKTKVQSVVTEQDLTLWYEKALRGEYAALLGVKLLDTLTEEIALEFPSVGVWPTCLSQRGYANITHSDWEI